MHLLLLFVWFSATLAAPVVPLHGSQGPKIQDYTLIEPMPTDTIINFSLVLVSRGNDAWKHHVNNATGADFQNRRYTNKAEFKKNHNHTDHAQPISSFARRFLFTILKFSPLGDHRISMSGSVGSVNKAFNTTLSYYQGTDGAVYRGYEGILYVQQDIHSRIATVLGLNNFTKFTRTGVWTPMDTTKRASSVSLTANKIAAMYNFPKGLDGTGQCIGIVELGGGQNFSDLTTALKAAGLKQIPQVTAVTIDGFTQDLEASSVSEVALDIQVIATIAPGAKIVVYYAPNSGQGTIDVYTAMINDVTSCGNGNHFTAISSSWGSPDVASSSRTTLNSVLQTAAAFGITITVAAGDHGSSNGNPGTPSVLWPAASDWVLACGGTAITVQSGKITDEVVWNSGSWGSGGGISSHARPSWQSQTYGATTLTGRGVPDVSAMADGNSVGFAIQYNGKVHSVGGTSGVAPLWAAFVALVNQKSGGRVGLLNPIIYGLSDAQRSLSFRDITSGNNKVSALDSVFYSAQPGWDACTGWGSPKNATNLMEAILGTDLEGAQTTAPVTAKAAPVVTSGPVTDTKSTAQVSESVSSSGTPPFAVALIAIGCLVMTTLFVLLIVAIKRAPEKERF